MDSRLRHLDIIEAPAQCPRVDAAIYSLALSRRLNTSKKYDVESKQYQ
jgi:hypothetical protein